MTDLAKQQKTAMELVSPDTMRQLSKQAQELTKQSLARMQAAGFETSMMQEFLVTMGTLTALREVNFIQQSNTLMQMAAQSGHLTPDLQEALMQTRAITLAAVSATQTGTAKASLEAFNRDLEKIFTAEFEPDNFWQRLFGG